ncbi:MAG: MipA/OmpV family protein, partial [Gammaproteobacteria bacterium]
MTLFRYLCVLLLTTWFVTSALATENGYNKNDPWGIAMGFRIARIPYPTANDQVSDVVPLLFYDNKYVYLRGLTGGIKLYTEDRFQLSLIGRYRFFDIPAEYQNQIRGSG